MRTLFPWSFHECKIGLFAAWKDGMPMTGPGDGRYRQTALFTGKAQVSVERNYVASEPVAFDHTGSPEASDCLYSITISFHENATEDDVSRLVNRIHAGGYHILTLLFEEETGSGQWTKHQYFYVTPTGDNLDSRAGSDDSITFSRKLALRAGWMQETSGSTNPPELDPKVLGEVEWICGPHRIPCLNYDPSTLSWTALGTNETSDSTPPYCAIGELENTDPFFSLMLPRLNEQEEIEWQNTIAFTLAKGESFVPQADHILQTEGISEPLILNRQNRFLDEPLAVFRFLRRVYASVGHGRICIPALFSDPPPATHFPRFQIGAVELLPQGAFNVNDLGSLSNYYRPDGSSVYLRPGGGYYLRPA